jgi:hypothetical protein
MSVDFKRGDPAATLPGPSRTITVEPLEVPREKPGRGPAEAPEGDPAREPGPLETPEPEPEREPEPEKTPA